MPQKTKLNKHWEYRKKLSRWRTATWIISKTRQKTKIRNAFTDNMSTDIKLCKAQICKITQLGGHSMMQELRILCDISKVMGNEALTKVAAPFAKYV